MSGGCFSSLIQMFQRSVAHIVLRCKPTDHHLHHLLPPLNIMALENPEHGHDDHKCRGTLNFNFSKYSCDICKIHVCKIHSDCDNYDDDDDFLFFHCDKCEVCVRGKREDFFHCSKCETCFPNTDRALHPCLNGGNLLCCAICQVFSENRFYCFTFFPTGRVVRGRWKSRTAEMRTQISHFLCTAIHSDRKWYNTGAKTTLETSSVYLQRNRCPLCKKTYHSNPASLWKEISEMIEGVRK